ncbi:MAG: M20 family metallopeptidase [Fusobacteria bacterium]|nr:M20 family metallopeptidase [Fusobacteriota bacterium]
MSRLKKYRRELHQLAELSLQEYKTKEYIKKVLNALQIETVDILDTGVIGVFKVNEGESIAFRSDMDALPIEERLTHEFASQTMGVMHACGHDGHMAMLLEFAHFLAENRALITKNIVLVFQPAEETIGGADLIVKSGILHSLKVIAIFGMHLFPSLEQGKIGSRSGEFIAKATEINIKFKGKSAHGAIPQNGVDAIMAASRFLLDVQVMMTREISPLEKAIVTFGKMHGGDVRNIVSEFAQIEGTIRVFNEDVYSHIVSRLVEMAKGYKLTHRIEVEIELKSGYPPVINDKVLFEKFKVGVSAMEFVEFSEPFMIAEDFSFYQRAFPGVFFFCGTKTLEHDIPLHNACYDFDEAALEYGVQAYICTVKEMGGLNGK